MSALDFGRCKRALNFCLIRVIPLTTTKGLSFNPLPWIREENPSSFPYPIAPTYPNSQSSLPASIRAAVPEILRTESSRAPLRVRLVHGDSQSSSTWRPHAFARPQGACAWDGADGAFRFCGCVSAPCRSLCLVQAPGRSCGGASRGYAALVAEVFGFDVRNDGKRR